MENKNENKAIYRIAKAIKQLKQEEDIAKLITELLTDNELRDLENRWLLMEALNNGSKQRDIAKEFGISLCKITRGSKLLKDETSVVGKLIKK